MWHSFFLDGRFAVPHAHFSKCSRDKPEAPFRLLQVALSSSIPLSSCSFSLIDGSDSIEAVGQFRTEPDPRRRPRGVRPSPGGRPRQRRRQPRLTPARAHPAAASASEADRSGPGWGQVRAARRGTRPRCGAGSRGPLLGGNRREEMELRGGRRRYPRKGTQGLVCPGRADAEPGGSVGGEISVNSIRIG